MSVNLLGIKWHLPVISVRRIARQVQATAEARQGK